MKGVLVFASILVATNAISGGHDSNITRQRWNLSLRDKGQHFCGATIIHQNWGLTTASCVDKRRSEDLSIRAGSSYRTGTDGFIVFIDYFIIHPKYNRLNYDSDIAILHFAKSITDDSVLTPFLPFCETCDIDVSKSVTMTGWGLTEPGGIYTDVLQMAQTSCLSRDICQFRYPSRVISLNMFCTGYPNMAGKITACEGDYGGPAMVEARMEGIISWGNGCGDSRYPTVITRLGTFMPWIRDITTIAFYKPIC